MMKYLRYLLITILCLGAFSATSQEHHIEDILGTWRMMGSFNNGQQVLVALKDTIKNPTHYFFTFNKNGTYTYDVISLKDGLAGTTRTGKWDVSPTLQQITFRESSASSEPRNIPKDFLDYPTDGTFSKKPMMFPIKELSKKRLVLYDDFHKTFDIYIK